MSEQKIEPKIQDVLIRNIITQAYIAGYEEANRPFRNSSGQLQKLVRRCADDIKTICAVEGV